MSTIKDVAKASGYSIATVSYALTGHKKIPIETQNKIKEIANELGYTPNVYARGLKNKGPKTIGVYLPGFRGPIHTTILSGIAKAIIDSGNEYKLIVSISSMGYDYIFDGLIDVAYIMSPVIPNEEVERISKKCSLILFDKVVNKKNIYNTFVNNEGGVCNRVIDFYNKGSKRFVFISGSAMSSHNSERLNGFKKGIENCGLRIEDQYILDGIGFTEHHGYDVMKSFLDLNLEFDAVIGSNDELSIGAIQAMTEKNPNFVKSVRVSGFDNIDKGNYITPTLSTISVDWYDYGIQVGNLAIEILKGQKDKKYINVDSVLIDRESGN